MYAIIETCGKQYRVVKGDTIVVDRLQAEVGSTISIDRVLLVHGEALKVGTPVVDGARVEARVTEHYLGEKLKSFKYVRTRRYRRRHGYRHHHTSLEILDIVG